MGQVSYHVEFHNYLYFSMDVRLELFSECFSGANQKTLSVVALAWFFKSLDPDIGTDTGSVASPEQTNRTLTSRETMFPRRPPVLRGCAVPPRVHVAAHQAVAPVPGPAAGLGREAAELLAEGLPSVPQVTPRCLLISGGLVLLFLKGFLRSRDTYSDRSGSSTPDSEISELKLPSITHE